MAHQINQPQIFRLDKVFDCPSGAQVIEDGRTRMLQYNGSEIHHVIADVPEIQDRLWINGKEICDLLGHKYHKWAIKVLVRPEYIKKYSDLQNIIVESIYDKNNVSPDSLFINRYGLYGLIAHKKSNTPIAEDLNQVVLEQLFFS
jgi:prophage antirepressor-like protein